MLDSGECQRSARLMVSIMLRIVDGGVAIFGNEGVCREGWLNDVGAAFVVVGRVKIMVSVSADLGERLVVELLVFLVAIVGISFMSNERLVVVLGLLESGFTLLVAHQFEFYNDK